ncbi:MAG TPA: AbrB/MazE/SpoVT family DNA-binding domain-containing protein [Candidatus Deferrimicrobiaceae bacterium]|nr:AbrB/MazE/SpoVT family DNA-binding domain-containing protein [Candidatus Deferrimicrobiaceae bacterium]
MTCDGVVTRKGQVTIPIDLRRKFHIEEKSRVQIIEKNGEIVIKKCPSFYDLAGTGAGEATVEELKKELDEMREEDHDE